MSSTVPPLHTMHTHTQTTGNISSQEKSPQSQTGQSSSASNKSNGKKAELQNLIDSTKPDIIIGTETWLDSKFQSSELFPQQYTTFRHDRDRYGGGVLIAVANHLVSQEVEELSVEGCELIWVKISLKGRRKLLVAAYYRPKASDEISLRKFETSIQRVMATNATIIIGGDFNLPSIDWSTKTLKSPAKCVEIHNQFLDLMNDAGYEQLVTFPTRGENTLDIFLTSHPSLVPRIEPLPGISDHDIVYLEFDTNPTRQYPTKRTVHQYSKADWSSLRSSADELSLSVLQSFDADSDTEQLWQSLKEGIASMIEKHIPKKTIGGKNNKPWVDYATLKMIRRRDRLYKQ
ncbi:hypothetical protein ACOMHN_056733 [Nucella lapillus]